ncbi:thiamine pyrophosphate-binding protein [Kribbella kalugense]|uniref:Thiamine pyrophosphate-dependent acetolactate synthase large subunit-like protein n=1 Tax=Kribbella kalugense TaxID=2512221 RepID=A0A4V3G8J4_9ACTN|nr:thiamine pyrophosphate-binding protein [Kribbella kalugense]TDW23154.1 thiamine pyrophosphate-dependent acetolactate synthase large subunit-like protein [Kribbella kalugense]
MNVADAVGRALAAAGVRQVFGVIGSGNFHLTNAMVAGGAQFVAARHEGGAATMADAYSRMSGTVAAISMHQGCGLTNAMTGIAEAAKSGTPMIVVAAEATEPRSNFYVDQDALARAVGAVPVRITSAETAVAEAVGAVETAVRERRTVLLNVPLSLQALEIPAEAGETASAPPPSRDAVVPDAAEVAALTDLLRRAERPVFVAGRGARGLRQPLEALAERSGALLATSAVAHGLFHGNPWSLGISGGFACPRTAELIRGADLIVGWGCALNMWTMRHGQLIAPDATVVQVDDDKSALGAHREIQLGITGDVELTATLALEAFGEQRVGYRTDELGSVRWRDVGYDDTSTAERIDPRTLSIALDDLLPAERVVAVDSGNFMGYPSAYLSVPDENGFCFTQAFQSIGLGLATAIGAALAQPDRLPVAALGDGGALMSAAELDTVRRLGLPMLVVVYNDDAYGAEVHHFGPSGYPVDTVTFPPTDIAAIGRGYGFEAATVRTVNDLTAVKDWLNGSRSAPMLVDAKVVADEPSWWLEEAFRGH